jgi:hypothetical protein
VTASNYPNFSLTRGSFLLSRLANYHPSHFSSYVFIDHGYIAPGRSPTISSIQQINNSMQSKLGFTIFGYFLFLNEEDAPRLLDENVGLEETFPEFEVPVLNTFYDY